ncbi:MAG: putative Ig domain-containing protein [Dehalococcoidales bacterium]|nr:putative Ig domain-containing protein [Dehalococcoidales bacterium]
MKFHKWPGRRSLGMSAGLARRLTAVSALVFLSAVFLISEPVWAAAPTIFPSTLPEGEVDVYYTTTLYSTATSPYTWAITGGALPDGLTLNAGTGVISGEPTTTGNYAFYVTVTDGGGTSTPQGFVINVTQTPLSFLTTSLPDATEGSSYSEQVSVTGGTSPYTWTIISGELPDGLVLKTSTGVISGTPDDDTEGDYSFTIKVTDSSTSPLSAQRSFSLSVEEGTFASVISVASSLASGETNVYVEGDWVAALEGGESVHLNLDLGSSQTVTVDETVSHDTNAAIRYIAEDDRIEVSKSHPDAHFSYEAEYFIEITTVPSEVGQVTDSDWYREGYIFTTTAPSQVEDTDDTRYSFSYWQLPTGGTVTSEALSLTITAPGAITANYDTEYYIEFETEPSAAGQITGSGWYSEGYTLRTSAPSQIEDTTDTQYRFSHWELATGETARDEDLSLTATAPGTITANYDTYYQLSLASPYGDMGSGTWHKAGSQAQWSLETSELPMSGILGVFGGKLIAADSSGTALMDNPKTIIVDWEPDYTRPILFISLIAVGVGLGVFFAYRRSKAPKPAPVAATPPTVVMIGDTSKPQSETTREKLLEKLSELLDKYEEEIKVSVVTEQAKELGDGPGGRQMLAAPDGVIDQDSMCDFTARKLLRVVTGSWQQGEVQPGDKGSQTVTWTRNIYNEWEILDCFLPAGHIGNHSGNFRIVYTLLNIIKEERTYRKGEEITPPQPHFTDGMPEVEVAEDQVISISQLPTEDLPS